MIYPRNAARQPHPDLRSRANIARNLARRCGVETALRLARAHFIRTTPLARALSLESNWSTISAEIQPKDGLLIREPKEETHGRCS